MYLQNITPEDLDDYMKDEAHYLKIKELIRKRKRELDRMLESNLNVSSNERNNMEERNYRNLKLKQINNQEMLNEFSRNTKNNPSLYRPNIHKKYNNFMYYINSKIFSQYMRYKQMYDLYMQDKKTYNKKIKKKEFNNFFYKHALHFKNDNISQCNYNLCSNDLRNISVDLLQNAKKSKGLFKKRDKSLPRNEDKEKRKIEHYSVDSAQKNNRIVECVNREEKDKMEKRKESRIREREEMEMAMKEEKKRELKKEKERKMAMEQEKENKRDMEMAAEKEKENKRDMEMAAEKEKENKRDMEMAAEKEKENKRDMEMAAEKEKENKRDMEMATEKEKEKEKENMKDMEMATEKKREKKNKREKKSKKKKEKDKEKKREKKKEKENEIVKKKGIREEKGAVSKSVCKNNLGEGYETTADISTIRDEVEENSNRMGYDEYLFENKEQHDEPDRDEKHNLNHFAYGDEPSEKFYANAEHPRRHDSSLEVLRVNIKNLIKKKTEKNEHGNFETMKENLLNSQNLFISVDAINKNNSIIHCDKRDNNISDEMEEKQRQSRGNSVISHKSVSVELIEEDDELTNINKQEVRRSETRRDIKRKSLEEIKLDDNKGGKEKDKRKEYLNFFNEPKRIYDTESESGLNISDVEEGVANENVESRNNSLISQKLSSKSTEKNVNNALSMEHTEETQEVEHTEEAQEVEHTEEAHEVEHTEETQEVEHTEEKREERVEECRPDKVDSLSDNSFKAKDREEQIFTYENDNSYENKLVRSGSEFSDQDLFDNSKYSKVKIHQFRKIIYHYDKNIFTFFKNLLVHSNINLVGKYQNRIFNVQIEATDMFQYLVSKYTQPCKSSKIDVEKKKKTNSESFYLNENEYKIVNEYICNNSSTSSLKMLYHKIHFIANQNYEEFKNRLLEGGVINLINLFHDEDINNFDKIFDVSFVNFCDIVGISTDSCSYHFNCIDKNYKGKRYIYLKHILQYLDVEKDMKEEYHKNNFISVHKKNLMYINISENYDNLNKFYKAVRKKNKLYISMNEFIYFFSEDEKMKKYNFSQEDIVSLYYSIVFYVYYTNKNQILQSLHFLSDNGCVYPNGDGNSTMKGMQCVGDETKLKQEKKENHNCGLTSDDGYNYVNYNLSLYKEYFTLDDFNFVIELKDIYFYFEGSECPFSKIKRRIIEIYGSVKKGILINREICNVGNDNDEEANSSASEVETKNFDLGLDVDSFKLFMSDRYRYRHQERISYYERHSSLTRRGTKVGKIGKVSKSWKSGKHGKETKGDDEVGACKIDRKTFMCLMYNIGIHINHCLTLWDNFLPFLECDMLDYKIFTGFLNGKINISNNETEDSINIIKNKILKTSEDKDMEFTRDYKNRLGGTICSRQFHDLKETNSTHALTVDEIEVAAQILSIVCPFNFLSKNEKKNFVQKLKKTCYKKGYDFVSFSECYLQSEDENDGKDKRYIDKKVVILLNGILRNRKDSNLFINSVNAVERDILCNYVAHTNVAVIEVDDTLCSDEFIKLVEKKKEISEEFMKIIDNVPIFKNFPYALKNSISMNIQKCQFEKKKIIIRQHDDPSNFYILKEGKINVYCNSADTPINTISDCTFFGELSLIFNTLRTCDIIVESDVAYCYSFSKEYFLSLLNQDVVKEFIKYFHANYRKEGIEHIIANYANGKKKALNFDQDTNGNKQLEEEKGYVPKMTNGVSGDGIGNTWIGSNRLSKGFSGLNELSDIHKLNSLRRESPVGSINKEFSSGILSTDNIILDVEYINQNNINSFYSDLDKIILNIFNAEQKYFVEEMETHLMKVKTFEKIIKKMKNKEQFLKNILYEKCPKGKQIILEGDPCEYFYFIKTGEISIQQFNQFKNMYDEIAIFGDNTYFGHQLILNKMKYFFIALAKTDSELYKLDSHAFEKFLSPFIDILSKSNDINQIDALTDLINKDVQKKKKEENFIIKVMKILKKVSIIQKLTDEELYNGAKHFDFKFVKKGKIIIEYEDTPDFFYIVKKGIVSVKVDNREDDMEKDKHNNFNINSLEDKEHTKKNNTIKCTYLYKYDYFGELSIINNQPRTATCEAHTNCFLLAIDKISFSKHFSTIFNDLLQEADIRYTKHYSLPPWLKSMYGNEIQDNMRSLSIKIPELDSCSSISDESSEVFSFEEEIKKKLKMEKRKEKKGKKASADGEDNGMAIGESSDVQNQGSLTISINEKKLSEIKAEKNQKIEEIKKKELKVFERIKLKEEKKIKAFMKKKGVVFPNCVNTTNDQPTHDEEPVDSVPNYAHLEMEQISSNRDKVVKKREKLKKENKNSKPAGVDEQKRDTSDRSSETIKRNANEDEGKNNMIRTVPQKSLSILKKKISTSSSSEFNFDKLVKKLIDFIDSEYNSIFHFYESIDKFNTGYIKYNDFLSCIISWNMEELFEGQENLENLFKYLCDGKNILTLVDFYRNVYKGKDINIFELNLRLSEVYGNTVSAFQKNVGLFNVDNCLCNYTNFETVCEKVGVSKANIKNIWDEINITNEENIPLEIIITTLNGELSIEESFSAYNNKQSLLNQVVHFFQGNEDLTKMSTDIMENNFEINYEEPIIINKQHHKIYPRECVYIVQLLETNIHFKYLTIEQRKFFTTLMNRQVLKMDNVAIKQNDEEGPIIFIYEGKANIITYNIFGMETVIRELENEEIYGCNEVINELPSDYEVKISSDSAIVWVLDRSVYKDNIKSMLEERKNNCIHILPVLRNVPILRYLPEELLHNISYAMKVEFHEPNHTIIKANTYDDKYYIICKGLATVEKYSEIHKNKLILSILKKADYFGELALIKNIKRTANVILDTPTILLSLVDSEFNRLFSSHFDKFLNRAKANYKKNEIENKIVSIPLINLTSTNNIGHATYNRSKNKKVTIQDNGYAKSVTRDLQNEIEIVVPSYQPAGNNDALQESNQDSASDKKEEVSRKVHKELYPGDDIDPGEIAKQGSSEKSNTGKNDVPHKHKERKGAKEKEKNQVKEKKKERSTHTKRDGKKKK
ncbi:rap guanine nucleotide exchange factor, putative (EPAC) [Plasmodium ovale wallikeri]|uniref:Rap guanine nucleotide exchange factor, putative (EPAC) n=1 Tax=Plasmodium ovale wallikeri TaxID=864142 RepID=A0A1A8ZQY4_PLAOA|nr:rap guanine nucleotide exchange factor, putative (EPAC) [Plasmodium ovale wallikeri]